MSTDSEERQRLEAQIKSHQEKIAQISQLIQQGSATETAVHLQAALDGEQRSLEKAQAELGRLHTIMVLKEEVRSYDTIIAQQERTVQRRQEELIQARSALDVAERDLAGSRHGREQKQIELESLLRSNTAAPVPAASTRRFEMPQAAILELARGERIPLPANKTSIIVGRADPASRIYPDIDLTAFGGEQGGVSRQHARLEFQHGQWSVTDLDSTSGTWVDNNRTTSYSAAPIHNGARLQFGHVAATFRLITE
ncbi:MAG: FHA domain-containing protein [Chloroflexaceae bacterium]|nr:FHA domain-containing protein [Chloroflexaceae bacterium]